VRSSPRPSAHSPVPPRGGYLLPGSAEEEEEQDDESRFTNRPCYEFNQQLRPAWNDRHCSHCRFYLTARCPHIDEFLDDVEDLSPE
jgi:hypothetical protein